MDKNTLMKFGFVKDEENLQLKEIFRNNAKLKEIHIDIYPENPLNAPTHFVLLLRTTEKNVTVSNDENRLVLKKSDKFGTYLMNILLTDISESFSKITDDYFEFILNIRNIYYRITIVN